MAEQPADDRAQRAHELAIRAELLVQQLHESLELATTLLKSFSEEGK